MKKIFTLALLAILGMGNAFADEVTMKYSGDATSNMLADGSNEAETLGLDASAWSVVAAKGSASNAPGLNKAGDFRLYYNANGSNTITVSSLTNATISKIAITFTGDTYSNVSVTADGNEVSGTDGVFNINSSSFVLGNGNTSNVQVRISQIVITYSAGGGQVQTKTATAIEFSGDYETRATCGKDESVNLPTAIVKAGESAVAGATVTWESSNTEIATISGNKVNIANGTQGDVTIKASYAGDDTYKESSKSYTLTVYKGALLLESLVADVTSSNEKWDNGGEQVSYWFVDENLQSVTNTVTFAKGQNIYLTDGTNNLLFYGTNSLNLKQGDVISGDLGNGEMGAVWGTLYRYNKLPEFKFTEMNVKVESEGAAVEPATITTDKLAENVNAYVKIEDAEFVEAGTGKNLKFKVGDTDLAIYNQWSVDVAALEAGAKYTLVGMGSVYKETYQLYLISFEKTGATGISSVKTATAQNGAIYNIAGQKVSASYKGLVIKNGKKIVNK